MEKKVREKRTYLTIVDVLVVAIILFGSAIIASSYGYLNLANNVATVDDNINFSALDDYYGIIKQSLLLLLAFGYLYLRKFDFSVWKIKFNLKVIGKGVLFFIIAALAMDIYTVTMMKIFPAPMMNATSEVGFSNFFTLSRILYSLLNGFYEEIFFLGVCLSVKPKSLKWVIPLSLIIRFSFHTYQGMITAIGLGFVLGAVFYLLYFKSKKKNLAPFFIAHTIADIFGLSILFIIQSLPMFS